MSTWTRFVSSATERMSFSTTASLTIVEPPSAPGSSATSLHRQVHSPESV